MRGNIDNFSEKYELLVKARNDIGFSYVYEIFLRSGASLRLDSSSVNLEKGQFNDSAENSIILTGIFSENSITRNMQLAGCKIKISYYLDDVLHPFVTYYISEFTKNDLDFIIKCEPETVKYNQSLLLLFSKTCRANFGDQKCGVDINQHKITYNVRSISARTITLTEIVLASGYYNLGYALFENEGRVDKFKIISHHNTKIDLEEIVPESLLRQERVSLIPTCDKNFRTCCNKFNNAINFRGEPSL